MARRKKGKPYRIVGAYDSETTNITINGRKRAFPILHQVGILDTTIEHVNAANVVEHTSIELYRHSVDLFARLDDLASTPAPYVPVLCCHNLAFDIQALSPYLDERRDNVRVLAKSCRKPISATICDDQGNARLVIWDTLQFSMSGLARMGNECGFPKLSGAWDYDLIRTPSTPLTDAEIAYAKHDIYTLLAWLGYWVNRNPDIDPARLGLNIVTKTGVVREKRRVRFANVKGNGCKYSAGQFWYLHNDKNAPKTDDELFTMTACTRGGFTFTASASAGIPFQLNDGRKVYAFDAASMHPAQMVSHRYPVGFHNASLTSLSIAFDLIANTPLEKVLSNWSKPFNSAILARYRFVNIRPKTGTLFAENGVLPLASARFKSVSLMELNEENQDAQEFNANLEEQGYKDNAVNPRFEFGKLVSADVCELYLTELTIWEIGRCYEWDSVTPIHGYITGRFERPTDFSVISVMRFYRAKNEFKRAMHAYQARNTIDNGATLRELKIPDYLVDEMENGKANDDDIQLTYKQLKADLNALFGIEATNEYRRDTILTSDGIAYDGDFGICNEPKTHKACYQFGQRIVGWSRIAQIVVLELIRPHIQRVINGDTDSIKVLANSSDLPMISKALARYAAAIDVAKKDTCKRVRAGYPSLYDPLDGIGHYELEFASCEFFALWNKAYITHDENGSHLTLAGVPTKGIERQYRDTPFHELCNDILGYNATLAPDITGLNQHAIPQWGELFSSIVADYRGNSSLVVEPASICIYPMAKTIGDTDKAENAINAGIARRNNPKLNLDPRLIFEGGIL